MDLKLPTVQECTSEYIYFIEDDELYLNSVSYEVIADSPVDAQDLARKPVKGWRRVKLALGEDLNEVSVRPEYEDQSWYIVDSMMGVKLKGPVDVQKYEALISF
jgi:hypothetical protein